MPAWFIEFDCFVRYGFMGYLGEVKKDKGGAESWGIEAMMQRASKLLQEFRDVQMMTPQMAVQRVDLRWKPPDSGVYKINFDGALFLNIGALA